MIATAHISADDLAPFERLRRQHFPSRRNFLQPHLTKFYQASDGQVRAIRTALAEIAADCQQFSVAFVGVRNLGSGISYSLAGARLTEIRDWLRRVQAIA